MKKLRYRIKEYTKYEVDSWEDLMKKLIDKKLKR